MNYWLGVKQTIRRHPFKVGIVVLCGALYMAFQAWNSFAAVDASTWNDTAISAIQTKNPSDFTFAVFGDSKDGYALFDALLKDMDTKAEATFAVVVGDMVNGGTRSNYRRFIDTLKNNLTIPLLGVIGNHDLNDDSDANYRAIFGAPNYHFAIGNNEFIILNAPTEDGVSPADRQWLTTVLENSQSAENRFVFMHVPPFDPRGPRYHKCLQDGADLMDIFQRYHVTHLFAGHIHAYFSGTWQGVPYTITGGGGGGLQSTADEEHYFHHYLAVHVHQGKVDVHVRPVSAGMGLRVEDAIREHGVQWGLGLAALAALLLMVADYRPSQTFNQ